MITSAFMNIFFWVISLLIGLLPTVQANSSLTTAIQTASSYVSGAYSFLPVITITLLAIVVFDVIFEGSYLFYKAIYWVIRRFPTQS